VVDAKVPTDRETGRPRGFAFVEFENDEDAQKSITLLNGRDLKGRPLRVNEAENRPPRPAGAGGGGGDRPPFRPSGGGGFRPGPGGPPRFGAPPGGGIGAFPPRDDFAAAFGKGNEGRRRKPAGATGNRRPGGGSEEGRRPPARRSGGKRQGKGFDPDND
jgi:cold-inducible RNA-binding protein